MGNYLDGYEKERCDHCKLKRTAEGHDGCIGFLPGVKNSCCGHGEDNCAYVQFDHSEYSKEPNKFRIADQEALDYIRKNRTILIPSEKLKINDNLPPRT